MSDSAEINRIVFYEVDANRWPDFERLFERRGGPKACWCMVWRATPAEAKYTDGASRKAAMAGRVSAGIPIGLLGYLDGEPVAWCSVAPRSTYRRLVDDGSSDNGIWSIACFFVVRRLRGQGITQRIINVAVEHARSHGAAIVEAYPVDPDSPSYRFMGFVPVFEEAGFCEVGRAGSRRHVMQLTVRPQRPTRSSAGSKKRC
ncbi:MAG: GNAT family N-acetyltransferase [Nitrospirae bacterium]|nr:GNAT family N-acetyltransferase [Nitrospirota bacterium]